MASNAQTDSIYFEGGLPGASRSISNAGTINFNSRGSVDIGHTGTDSVVFTNTGTINLTNGGTAGLFNVGNTAGAYGKFIQSSPTSTFLSAIPVQFSFNTTGFVSGGGGVVGNAAAGQSALDIQAGTFAVGGTTGAGTLHASSAARGSFLSTQSGGVGHA